MDFISHIGRYFMMLFGVFSIPEKPKMYWDQFTKECINIGISSLGIVLFISTFMGAVITMQTAAMLADSAWIPEYTLGYTTRQSTILEFSPTIICLILAGKVGSNIASEIGTMRVTEQIDALDIMGVNSQAYLIAPKIFASIFTFPFLIIFSMAFSIAGGYFVCVQLGFASGETYVEGIRAYFLPNQVTYGLVKPIVFGFIISSVSAYFGYFTKGGALDVGKSSTKAVVMSSVLILIGNFIITQLMLL